MIDKDALLKDLRNATQSPNAVEAVIQRLERGDYETASEEAADEAGERRKKK